MYLSCQGVKGFLTTRQFDFLSAYLQIFLNIFNIFFDLIEYALMSRFKAFPGVIDLSFSLINLCICPINSSLKFRYLRFELCDFLFVFGDLIFQFYDFLLL